MTVDELLVPRTYCYPTPKTEKAQIKAAAQAAKLAAALPPMPETGSPAHLAALAGLPMGVVPATANKDTFADNYITTLAAHTSAGATSFTPATTAGNPGADPSNATWPTQFTVVIQSANYPLSGTRDVVTVTDSRTTPWACSAITNTYEAGDTIAAVVGAAALNSISARATASVRLVRAITASAGTTLFFQNGTCFDVFLDANFSFGTPTGIPSGLFSVRFRFTQDSTGNRVFTPPPGSFWNGETALPLQNLHGVPGNVDIVQMETWDSGTTWNVYYVTNNLQPDIQHGGTTITPDSSTKTVTFPRAFGGAPHITLGMTGVTNNTATNVQLISSSSTNFTCFAKPAAGGTSGATLTLHWIAAYGGF